jgi:ribonuclease P protein component
MPETLKPHERIRKKKDFILLYKRGRRYRGKYFTLVFQPNELDFSRMAVVASKKIGNAVKRNKVKRWLRTLYRRNKELIENSLDMIIISKKEIHNLKWNDLEGEYLSAIKSINRDNPTL